MADGGFTFCLIVTVELVVLLRLALPRVLDFAEARYDEVYGVAHGDCPHLPTLKNPLDHSAGDTL